MAFNDGQGGQVRFTTTPRPGTPTYVILKVKSWKATEKVSTDEVTNTTSGGYGDFQGVVKYLDVDLTALWDSATEPEATTPKLQPGTYVCMDLAVDATAMATPTYAIAKALIESVEPSVDAKGVVTYSLKAKSCGAYTAN